MEKEPLLPYISPRMPQPPPLCPVPENAEITIPPTPLTPSSKELKDMLIFGSPSSSSSLLKETSSSSVLEALTLSLTSPKLSITNLDDERTNLDPENQKSWLLDPKYSASKSNLHRSKTAPAMATINEIDHSSCTKQPQFGKSSIVRQGFLLLIVYLALGVVIYSVNKDKFRGVETHPVVDALYFCIVTMCTIGAFISLTGRMFASVWLLVSTLAVARAFLYLAEARVDKRHRRMAKWVLGQDMTVAQFLAADIDNNGFVSKSEYVIYKLKEMCKVSEKDIFQICRQFDRLDTGNCGKITLGDLMESHH